MNIWEAKVFKIYVRLHQGVIRYNSLLGASDRPYYCRVKKIYVDNETGKKTEVSTNYSREKKTKLRHIPKPFSPFKSDDMCLSDLLEKRPEYRYEDRNMKF